MKQRLTPYLYIAPHVVFFTMFIIVPLFGGVYISMHRWSIEHGREAFVGLKYYTRLFDPENFSRGIYFWKSLWVSCQFILYFVPPLLIISLLLALLLHHCKSKGLRMVAQFCILAPTAVAVSVSAVIWRWMLGYEAGVINYMLQFFGIAKIPWMADLPWAWFAIILPTLWMACGWSMVLFLVGLQTIPKQLYEAVQVDGANNLQQFFYITLPGLQPITMFILITQIIGAFSLFAQPQLLTAGGPGYATTPIMLYLYGEAFNGVYPRVGSSVAMALVAGMVVFSLVSTVYLLMGKRRDA